MSWFSAAPFTPISFVFKKANFLMLHLPHLAVNNRVFFLYFTIMPRGPAASRSRSRSNISQEGEIDGNSQESLQELMPEDVLVISLGVSPQSVPGMMSENEVLG